MIKTRTGVLASGMLTILLLAGSGCERRVLWEYRDDPYLADYAQRPEAQLLRKLRSRYTDDRQITLRILADRAAAARRAGNEIEAERLVQILLNHYRKDRNPGTRGTILEICLPVAGPGSRLAETWLRERIADGSWTIPAARTLALVSPDRAAPLISPLTQHPILPVRYEAALVLCNLGDRRSESAARDVLAEMAEPAWPRRVAELPLAQARANLAARIERIWPAADGPAVPVPLPGDGSLAPRPPAREPAP